MGKARTLLVAGLLVGTSLLTQRSTHAQSTPPPSCSTTASVTPMQGHYTGPWQSSADYQFAVFGTTLDMQVNITGTLDLNVSPEGQVTGTAAGNVNAPITDYGRHDISSGYGTIDGSVSGAFPGSGSLLILTAPVIDMHWGTFGGHAVEENITMPAYQMPVSAFDCISGSGTISEQNFPQMNVVPDGTSMAPVQVPGIGTATGTWQMTNDDAAIYGELSQKIDSFTSAANTLLSGPTVNITSQTIRDIIVTPLQTLESDIALHPDVSRCLNERLDAWKSSALPQIYADALKVGSDLPAERAGFDLLHTRMLLGTSCQATDGAGAPASLLDGLLNAVEGDFAGRSWQRAALEVREVLLQGGDVKSVILEGIQAAARGTPDRGTLLDIARVSYAYGDDADSATIASRAMPPLIPSNHQKHHKKRHHRKSHPASPSAPRPSLSITLSAGLGAATVTVGSGSMPFISWQAVSGASDYAVTVLGPDRSLLWSWSGKGTSTVYGDTTIDGVPDTEITWPLPLPASGYTVSLMALDSSGKIIAAKLRG